MREPSLATSDISSLFEQCSYVHLPVMAVERDGDADVAVREEPKHAGDPDGPHRSIARGLAVPWRRTLVATPERLARSRCCSGATWAERRTMRLSHVPLVLAPRLVHRGAPRRASLGRGAGFLAELRGGGARRRLARRGGEAARRCGTAATHTRHAVAKRRAQRHQGRPVDATGARDLLAAHGA